jgi:hypothetical protein
MKCEICSIIEKFGLDPSAHDLWFCSGVKPVPVKQPLRATLATFVVKAAMFHRLAAEVLMQRLGQLAGAGIHSLRTYREHYITLGL